MNTPMNIDYFYLWDESQSGQPTDLINTLEEA